ncbi:hypothetical protein WJ968_26605 [Achromobacter xylosoxidans]
MNQQPQFPTINASYWQAQSYRIDSGAPVCVPINPIGWAYLRGCSPLVQELSWGGHSLNFQPISFSSGMGRLTIPIPEAALNGRGIQALAIAVKPTVAREQPFAARIVLTLKDESVRYLTGAMRLKPAGALLLIDASPCPGEPDRGGGTANGCARGSGAEGAFRGRSASPYLVRPVNGSGVMGAARNRVELSRNRGIARVCASPRT